MADSVLDKINGLLHEEKWTRATIATYNLGHLKELESIFQEILNSDNVSEVFQLCEEHLQENKSTIAAMYFSGMISLKRQSLDDSQLIKLVSLFSQNQKTSLVEHLCKNILDSGENKFALKTLVDLYRQEGNEEKVTELEERLVRVDMEDAETVLLLAQKYDKTGDPSKSTEFYKKAIHRFLLKKNFARLLDVWNKLLDLIPNEYEYFAQIETKVSKTLGWDKERSLVLLEGLYPVALKNQAFDNALEILMRMQTHEGKTAFVRREIIEILKKKYHDNPKIEDYIRLSGLSQSFRSMDEAMRDFQKHLAFAKGNFVFHNTWGVGRISEIREKEQEFVIDFEKRRGHTMAQKMAVEALQNLSTEDIRVKIAVTKKDDLKKKIKEDHDWALKTIIRSFGNNADFKIIRAALTPSILTTSEWTNWSSHARTLLKKSPDYAVDPDKPDFFMVRSQPVTFEEKAYNKFRVEKDFYKRIEILEEMVEDDKVETDFFSEIFNSFVGYLKLNKVNDEVLSAFLILERLSKKYAFLNLPINKTFKEYFAEIENLEDIYRNMKNTEIKRLFLSNIRKELENWPEYYIRLIMIAPAKSMIEELLSNGKKTFVVKLFRNIMDRFREQKEALIWLARYLMENDSWETYSISKEKVIINLLNILEQVGREIANKKELTSAKRQHKNILIILLKDKLMETYLDEASEESVLRIFTLVQDIKEIPANETNLLRQKVGLKFPHLIQREDSSTRSIASRKGLLTTRAMYNKKSKELSHLVDVEIPQNSKEIGEAMALGDLKENAEYHAAKEKQGFLNSTVSQLSRDLETATVIDPADVDMEKIVFGVRAVLLNKLTNQEEIFIILGPWESKPEDNIISYLSPLGDKLLGNKKGDELKFTINERLCDYQVIKIEKAEFL